jgi:hypothetical protein
MLKDKLAHNGAAGISSAKPGAVQPFSRPKSRHYAVTDNMISASILNASLRELGMSFPQP